MGILEFLILVSIIKTYIYIVLGHLDERLDELLTKKFDAKARLTEISVNDLIGYCCKWDMQGVCLRKRWASFMWDT